MALENGTYVNSLVTSNPASTDGLAQADDHIRLIKSTIKNTFPNITGPVNSTQAQLDAFSGSSGDLTYLSALVATGVTATEYDYLDGVTSNIQTQIASVVSDVTTIQNSSGSGTITNVSTGTGLTGGGSSGSVTVSHSDTSSQASVSNSGTTVIQSVIVDGFGHITGLTSATIAASSAIGDGQTWQDMSGSRSVGTSYQNSTGRTIMIGISTYSSVEGYVQVSTNNSSWVNVGTTAGHGNTYGTKSTEVVVPAGHYYKVTAGTLLVWAELR